MTKYKILLCVCVENGLKYVIWVCKTVYKSWKWEGRFWKFEIGTICECSRVSEWVSECVRKWCVGSKWKLFYVAVQNADDDDDDIGDTLSTNVLMLVNSLENRYFICVTLIVLFLYNYFSISMNHCVHHCTCCLMWNMKNNTVYSRIPLTNNRVF